MFMGWSGYNLALNQQLERKQTDAYGFLSVTVMTAI